jgi:hypothetical protein
MWKWNSKAKWPINLEGQSHGDSGDVVTDEGEVIGTWEVDENDRYSFIPKGAQEPLFMDSFAPMLCRKIAAWHEGQSAAD